MLLWKAHEIETLMMKMTKITKKNKSQKMRRMKINYLRVNQSQNLEGCTKMKIKDPIIKITMTVIEMKKMMMTMKKVLLRTKKDQLSKTMTQMKVIMIATIYSDQKSNKETIVT
jgi:hypothetical protein